MLVRMRVLGSPAATYLTRHAVASVFWTVGTAVFLAIGFVRCSWFTWLPVAMGNSVSWLVPTLVGAVAALAGIFVAVYAVAFEIERRRFAGYEHLVRRGGIPLQYFLHLPVYAILVGTWAMVTEQSTHCHTYSAFSLILFVAFMLALLWSIAALVTAKLPPDAFSNLTNDLTPEDLDDRGGRFGTGGDPRGPPPTSRKNPLDVLSAISKAAIRNGDLDLALAALNATAQAIVRVEEQERHEQKHRASLGGACWFFREVAEAAMQAREERVLKAVVVWVEVIYRRSADNNLSWVGYLGWNEGVEQLATRIMEERFNTVFDDLLWAVHRSYFYQLSHNVPPALEIWTFDAMDQGRKRTDADHEKSNQWHNISEQIPGLLANLGQSALRESRGTAVNQILRHMESMANEVFYAGTMEEPKRKRVFRHLTFNLREVHLGAARQGIPVERWLVPSFSSKLTMPEWQDGEIQKMALAHDGELLLDLLKEGRFQASWWGDLATVAFAISDEAAQNPAAARAIQFIGRIYLRAVAILTASGSSDRRVWAQALVKQMSNLIETLRGRGLHSRAEELRDAVGMARAMLDGHRDADDLPGDWPAT